MDLQSFVGNFLSSAHGRSAALALAAQGIRADKASEYLAHAAAIGHAHVEKGPTDLLGENLAASFLTAFATGLAKGDGLLGALGDGVEGALVGRVTEALAARAGLDSKTASTIAAAATPHVVSFLKAKLES
jgi:hypothetical protein